MPQPANFFVHAIVGYLFELTDAVTRQRKQKVIAADKSIFQ